MRRGILLAAGLAVLVGLTQVATAQPARVCTIVVDNAYYEGLESDRRASIRVSGHLEGATLPNGLILSIGLTMGDQTPGEDGWRQVPITDGRFEAVFGPYEEMFLPAEYALTFVVDPANQRSRLRNEIRAVTFQATEYPISVTPELEEETRAQIRDRYALVLLHINRLHGQMGQWGSFILDRGSFEFMVGEIGEALQIEHEVESETALRDMLARWRNFEEGIWEAPGGYAWILDDYLEFRKSFYLSYYPEADQLIRELLVTMRKWHAAYFFLIYSMANMEDRIPDTIMADVGLPRQDLYNRTMVLARDIYAALGLPWVPWDLIDLNQPESSEFIDGDHFRSLVSKFEVTKPSDGWDFDVAQFDPMVRLRIRPTDEVLRQGVVMVVEISDYPLAESFSDLERVTEIDVSMRWPSYLLLMPEPEAMKVTDLTMEGDPNECPGIIEGDYCGEHSAGVRPGIRLQFSTEVGGVTYTVEQYTLFCRWHKRTYSLIGMAPTDLWPDVEDVFRAACESFNVLDAPALRENH